MCYISNIICFFLNQLCLLEPLQFIHSSLHSWQRRTSRVVQFAKEFFKRRLSCKMWSVTCSQSCVSPRTNWSQQSLSLKKERKNVMRWWVLNQLGKVLSKWWSCKAFSLEFLFLDCWKLCWHLGCLILGLGNSFKREIFSQWFFSAHLDCSIKLPYNFGISDPLMLLMRVRQKWLFTSFLTSHLHHIGAVVLVFCHCSLKWTGWLLLFLQFSHHNALNKFLKNAEVEMAFIEWEVNHLMGTPLFNEILILWEPWGFFLILRSSFRVKVEEFRVQVGSLPVDQRLWLWDICRPLFWKDWRTYVSE